MPGHTATKVWKYDSAGQDLLQGGAHYLHIKWPDLLMNNAGKYSDIAFDSLKSLNMLWLIFQEFYEVSVLSS